MMRTTRHFWLIALLMLAFSAAGMVHAACPDATVPGPNNCLFASDFSAIGGDLVTASQRMLASNMYPFQRQSTEEELKQNCNVAKAYLVAGQTFRNSLTALTLDFDPTKFECPGNTLQQRLYCEVESNYETLGLVDTDRNDDGEPDACTLRGTQIANLLSARNTFAYQLWLGWYPPGSSLEETKAELRAVLRTIADLYLVVADEFFIDGTEFRVRYDNTWSLDKKLDAQIGLVTKSRLCYTEAVNSFVYGFSPAVGTNIYASDSYDNVLMGLFNLTVERWSSAWREESSKRRVRGLSSSKEGNTAALDKFKSQLRETAIHTYLLSGALAKEQGSQFPANGGKRIKVALDYLRVLENTTAAGFNPLGYDERFVPLRDFSSSPGLYEDARIDLATAEETFKAFQNADRTFRYDIERLLEITRNNANTVFRQQLNELTGIPMSDPQFVDKAGVAGNDFSTCGLDLENTPFVTCMTGKATGTLAAKYYEMHRARQSTNLALRLRDNALAEIEIENTLHNSTLEIENKYNNDYRDTLIHFTEQLHKARTIVKSEEKAKGKDGKTETTTTSYYLRNDDLDIDLDKGERLQEIMRDYQIAKAMAGHEAIIKRLINDVAAREIEIGLAIQAENAAVLDFNNLIRSRDNQVFLLTQAIIHAQYDASQVAKQAAEMRILRSQAALDFGSDLNQAVRFAYLAAKRLEYEYLRPLVNIGQDNLLNLTDLYKIQDVGALGEFLDKLDHYHTCGGYGARQKARLPVSFAIDILGLTDKYLDPDGNMTPEEIEAARAREWQGYLLRNIKIDPITQQEYLRLSFSTSLTDPWIAERGFYNMKIWYGVAAPPCDPVFTGGVAIHLDSNQTGNWKPYAILSQEGSTTFLDKDNQVVGYEPVNEYLNLVGVSADQMFSSRAVFDVDSGLYTDERPPNGTLWNNGLKGRSVAASKWVLEVGYYTSNNAIKTIWSDIADIWIHFDVLGTPKP